MAEEPGIGHRAPARLREGAQAVLAPLSVGAREGQAGWRGHRDDLGGAGAGYDLDEPAVADQVRVRIVGEEAYRIRAAWVVSRAGGIAAGEREVDAVDREGA